MSSTTITLKRNDTAPFFTATCLDADGAAVDISNSTVRFHMMDNSGTIVVDAAAEIVSGPDGTVKYEWTAADTDTSGKFKAEVEVTHADDTVQTFPSNTYTRIIIRDDIA